MAGVRENIIRPSEGIGSSTPLPGVSAEAFGAGVGGAIEEAGARLHGQQVRALRVEQQRKEEAANASAAAGVADLSLELQRSAQTARDDAALDGAGHVERVTVEADDRINSFLETIPDQRVRQRWSARLREIRSNLIGDEDGWARGRRIESIGTNAKEAKRLWGNQLQGNPDPHVFEQALKAGNDFWDGVDAPADVKDKGLREWGADSAENYAVGTTEKDPAVGLALLQSGALDHWLDPDRRKALINEAETGVRIAAADQRRVASQQEAQYREDVHEYLQRINDRGEVPNDKETQELVTRGQALGLTNLVDDVQYSQGKRKLSLVTDKWTSADWEREVNGLATKVAGGKASADEQQQLNILQELRGAKEQRFKSDPEGFAAASGITAPQVDLSNPSDPNVPARKSWARSYARTAGLLEPPYLNKDQLQVYYKRAEQGPVGQLEVAAELRRTWGMDAAPSIVRQIGGEGKGDMLVMLGLNDRMAQVYRRGHEAIEKKTVKLDDKAVSQAWQQFLPAVPPDVAPALLDTARKIAAGWMLEQGKSEPTADFADVFGKAVHRAAGMLGSQSENSATGGFAKWNGRYAWLPQDMGRTDMQQRISRAAPTDWIRAAVDDRGNPTNAVPHHLGPDGKLKPYTNGEALRFGAGTLQTIAPGIYRLVDPAGGAVVDQRGRPWQFDIRRLPRSHVGTR